VTCASSKLLTSGRPCPPQGRRARPEPGTGPVLDDQAAALTSPVAKAAVEEKPMDRLLEYRENSDKVPRAMAAWPAFASALTHGGRHAQHT
jgi:hypothetical protein